VGYVNFTWKSGAKRYYYNFDRLQTFDEGVLEPPMISINTSGRVPKKPKGEFDLFSRQNGCLTPVLKSLFNDILSEEVAEHFSTLKSFGQTPIGRAPIRRMLWPTGPRTSSTIGLGLIFNFYFEWLNVPPFEAILITQRNVNSRWNASGIFECISLAGQVGD